jgi:hypothetical protein
MTASPIHRDDRSLFLATLDFQVMSDNEHSPSHFQIVYNFITAPAATTSASFGPSYRRTLMRAGRTLSTLLRVDNRELVAADFANWHD